MERTNLNAIENKDWENKIKNIKLDKTLGWEIAQVTNVSNYLSTINLINSKKKENLHFKELEWTGKKNFQGLIFCW